VDEQAKENSEHAAERSSRLLQVELVQIDEWLRCVAFAEVFVAADYQPADDIVKKNYFLAITAIGGNTILHLRCSVYSTPSSQITNRTA
jgi:hypothetical protein